MLDAQYLYQCTDDISALYAELEASIIEDIARRVAKTGKVTATAEWQMIRAKESGAVYQNAINEIAKLLKKSNKEVHRLFMEAAKKSTNFDNAIYNSAGQEPFLLMQSEQALQVLNAGIIKTAGLLKNMTLTTASTAQQAFISASNLAYMQISSGAFDYNSAIVNAVKTLARDGVSMVDYTGRTDHIDVAVRRATLTGVNQTALKITEIGMEENDVELVETSSHSGARPDHELWQGKVFGRKGATGKYRGFVEATGYGTVTGLGGVNCRHSFFPFYPDAKPIAKEPDKPDITYGGKVYTFYEATQRQRTIERNIRRWKREKMAMESAGQPSLEATKKLREWQKEAREFSRVSGVTRRPENERVVV